MDQDIQGTVISTEANEIVIAIQDEAQCHSCGLKDSCANKTLTLNKTEVNYEARKGEQVKVIYNKLLQTSTLLYMLPLFAFFAGVVLANILFKPANELYLFVSGAVVMTLVFLLIKIFSNKLTKKDYRIQIQPLR